MSTEQIIPTEQMNWFSSPKVQVTPATGCVKDHNHTKRGECCTWKMATITGDYGDWLLLKEQGTGVYTLRGADRSIIVAPEQVNGRLTTACADDERNTRREIMAPAPGNQIGSAGYLIALTLRQLGAY